MIINPEIFSKQIIVNYLCAESAFEKQLNKIKKVKKNIKNALLFKLFGRKFKNYFDVRFENVWRGDIKRKGDMVNIPSLGNLKLYGAGDKIIHPKMIIKGF